jgi:hypothetical protein
MNYLSSDINENTELPLRFLAPMMDMTEGSNTEFEVEYDPTTERVLSCLITHAGSASIEEINDFVFLLNSESSKHWNLPV